MLWILSMTRNPFLFAAAALLALSAVPVAAKPPELVHEEVEEGPDTIVVAATRTARDLSKVGASVTVVREPEIVARQPSHVLDILRTLPGITVTRNGGIGTKAGVSIRGAESGQTVVLIDGVKLNDPAAPDGGFDFGPLLMGNIARVEVVRGAQSVLYGSQAIGGVVDLITRAPSETPDISARVEYGGRDTAQLVGNVAGRIGPAAASIGATYLRTDGISAFSEARGGTESDGFESRGVNGKFELALADELSLDLRAFYAHGVAEVDGFPAPLFVFADTAEISTREDFVGYAGISGTFLDGRFRNRLGFALTDIRRRNVDHTGNTPAVTFEAAGKNRRFEYQGVFRADGATELVFGAERGESRFRNASYGGPADEADTWINGVYGQVNLTPSTGLSLTGGVRFDDHEVFGSATTFAASGAYSPNGGRTRFRASYGEGFRAPSLYQLFGPYGSSDLRPEKSQSWDVGVTEQLLEGLAQIGITRFERASTNLIGFVSTATPPFGFYDNIARTNAKGWEVGLALKPTAGFDVAIDYTLLDARDEASGNRLALRAKDKLALVADWRPAEGFGVGITVLMVGDSFDDAANSRRLDGYVIADLRASCDLTAKLQLFGRVENLFDEAYETVLLYGQPGRAVFGGLRFRL